MASPAPWSTYAISPSPTAMRRRGWGSAGEIVVAFTGASSIGDLDERLAEIFAFQKPDQFARRVLNTRCHVFAVLDLAFLDPPRQLAKALLVSLGIVEDEEAFDAPAGADQVPEEARPQLGFLQVILGYLAANNDARLEIEEGKDIVGDAAADIVEIDIDALRAGGLEIGGQIPARAVIDASVVAEFLGAVFHLRLGPGRADGTAAFELGDLAHNAADGTRGRRDDDRFTRLRLAEVEECEICGETGHAEDAECGRDRGEGGI